MSDLVNRLRMRLDRESGMSNLDQVVTKYGVVEGNAFTFQDHEFQREIIRDTSSRIYVRKCSQVGLSELMVQKLLAMASSLRHVRIIFTLPTRDMASAFSKDRVDGLIDNSDFYSGLVETASNSASQKKIGSCMLYITGSFGANSAISVPAEVIINDEVDFSNPVVLGKLSSRLRHANMVDEHGIRGLRYMFSTPTVGGFGIDEGFTAGTQKYYHTLCEHCETWQNPTFDNDFYVPGYSGEMKDFSREDSYRDDVILEDATILCPNCRLDIFPSMKQPERRKFIALFPDRIEQSYQVNPWDVPKYNTPYNIIKQIQDYPLKSDFYNFVLGLPFTDADNTFSASDAVRGAMSTVLRTPPEGASIVMGMDVGKTCHLSIGIKTGDHIAVFQTLKIRNNRETPALPQVLELYDKYKCASFCVDSGPDITLVNQLTAARPNIVAVVYVNSIKGPKIFEEKEREPVMNADRTKALTNLLNKHNSGDINYPADDVQSLEIFKHLQTTKKIRVQSTDGAFSERFVNTSKEDHWVHSLNYLALAAERLTAGTAAPIITPGISVSKIRVGASHLDGS